MKKLSLLAFRLAFGLFAVCMLHSTPLLAQMGGGTIGTYTRLLPTTRMSSVTINKGDTLVLSMGDYETLTIHPGIKVTSIDVSHRPVMNAVTSADRWVTEQLGYDGRWYTRDDHSCLRTSPLPDDPMPPLHLVVPGEYSRDYYLSNALCTGGVREIMLIAN